VKRVTICVLLYGDHFKLAKKCINSIVKILPKELYELRVGMNECCEDTIKHIKKLSPKYVDRIYEEDKNIDKYPLMTKMFKDIDTEFIWWFDDDCFIKDELAIIKRLKAMDSNKDKKTVVLGHTFFFGRTKNWKTFRPSVNEWCKKQVWYEGKKEPSGKNEYTEGYCDDDNRKFWFPTGYSWFARTDFIKEIEYPKGISGAGDVAMSFAIRQKGYRFQGIGGCHMGLMEVPSRKNAKTKKLKELDKIKNGIISRYKPFNYGVFYSHIAKMVNFKTFVELGSWQGNSIVFLSNEIQKYQDLNDVKIYAVDLFEDTTDVKMKKKYSEKIDIIRRIYNLNLKKHQLENVIKTIKKDTSKSANDFEDSSIDFCFIDASHDYESVKKDIESWYPKIKRGGIIAGHDYDNYHRKGVIRAVDEFFTDGDVTIFPKTTVWFYEK